jgi:hypothetical protein
MAVALKALDTRLVLLFTEPKMRNQETIAATRHIAEVKDDGQLWLTCAIGSLWDQAECIPVLSRFGKCHVERGKALGIDLDSLCNDTRQESMNNFLSEFLEGTYDLWSTNGIWVTYGNLSDAASLFDIANSTWREPTVLFSFGSESKIFTRGLAYFTGQEMEFCDEKLPPYAMMYSALITAYYLISEGPIYQNEYVADLCGSGAFRYVGQSGGLPVKIERE